MYSEIELYEIHSVLDHVYDGISALFAATNQDRPYEQLLYNWKKWPSSDFPLF